MNDCISGEQEKVSIVETFVEKKTHGKGEHFERFYEIFSARGFLLELDSSSGKVRLSDHSHREDSEFLEILQNIDYKKMYHKPHDDAIYNHYTDNIKRYHVYFDTINTDLYDIDNNKFLTALFTHEIPVDIFRLNWERNQYAEFDKFKTCEHIPEIRVYDLEPFIARLVKAISSVGISTWSSCEGHWGEPAYIKFDGKYHRIWCQAIFHTCIKKNIRLVCEWEWWRWDDRCSIHSHDRNLLELYLEIQDVAKYIYDHRFVLRDMKKQICSLLSPAQKNMKQKELLRFFESHIEEFLIQTNWKIISH